VASPAKFGFSQELRRSLGFELRGNREAHLMARAQAEAAAACYCAVIGITNELNACRKSSPSPIRLERLHAKLLVYDRRDFKIVGSLATAFVTH